ncbi:MAG: hypothetical protein WDZ83_14305 [Rhizobiaceae bacterium]
MTDSRQSNENRGNGAPPISAAPDRRILAFVRMLARRAAERDYARQLEAHGKARNNSEKEGGKS